MFLCGIVAALSAIPDDYTVVPRLSDYEPEQLFLSLMSVAEAQYAERAAKLDALRSPDDWRRRQAEVRDAVTEMIGGFPERTPLNARIVGILDYEDYRIEKVIYESRPAFYVTANVYVPKREHPPHPAILSPCGHSSNGKAYDVYQRSYIAAVKQGYVVLAYDPISQGERLQILNERGQSRIGVGTGEHCHQGNQGYLIGVNLAQIRVWDGIRSLDYLTTRSDVDAERIVVMGNSGGGTLTTYLCALDSRIAVASPNCFVTTLLRRFYSRVSADPEQNFVRQIARGVDHSDMLAVMAPRPVQIGAKRQDFFPIEGTREATDELRRVYDAFGASEAVDLVEEEGPHGFTVGLRQGTIRWMNRWLNTPTPDYIEPPIQIEEESRLLCTETGQVLTSLGGRTVFDLYRDAALERMPMRPAFDSPDAVVRYRETVEAAAKELLAWEITGEPLNPQFVGAFESDGCSIERIVFVSEPGIVVPALVVSPSGATGKRPCVIYVHEDGKSADLDEVLRLAGDGVRVVAMDPRGMGETRSPHGNPAHYYDRYAVETDLTYTSFMIGKPLLGLRTRDVVRAVDYALSRDDVSTVAVFGVRMGAIIVLHAALFDARITSVTLREMLLSYKSLVLSELYDSHVNAFVPNVIGRYDLADVVAAIAPRSVTLRAVRDEMKRIAPASTVVEEYRIAIDAYRVLGASEAFSVS
jgi:cephalosporin-C deacetylase-like acetyl esterase